MKRWGYLIGSLMIGLLCVFILWNFGSEAKREKMSKNESVRIGVSLYRFDDTFISGLRKTLEGYVKEYEKEHKMRINMEILDAAGSQIIQNKQIDRFISLKYDVLIINPVERADASTIIDKAMRAKMPVIFFNREPVEDDMNRSDSLFYVGSDPKESAILEGEILVKAYHKEKKNLDQNGDGFVGYVLLEGEPSHQDSLVRTEWSTKTLRDGGVPIIKLTGGVANWERSQAAALMEGWFAKYGEEIELVLSNNDDMALGAIDVLESLGRSGKVKVVGIDGTEAALEALEKGSLFGTVSNNKEEYAKVMIEIAISKHLNKVLPEEIEKKMVKGKYYYTEQYPITK